MHIKRILAIALFLCLLAALFVWKIVPETKGKTLEDMNALWTKRETK